MHNVTTCQGLPVAVALLAVTAVGESVDTTHS